MASRSVSISACLLLLLLLADMSHAPRPDNILCKHIFKFCISIFLLELESKLSKKKVATRGDSNSVLIYDTGTAGQATIARSLNGHPSNVTVVKLINPFNLATGSSDGEIVSSLLNYK
jgi:hypothetical protein